MTPPKLSVAPSEPAAGKTGLDRVTASSVDPDPASPIEDPVPAEVHAVIDLYANQLAKVSFPEIDAGSLRRQADELRTEARAVARAREALDAALATFAARIATLTQTAARAVAYARIYSEAHPERQALAAAIAVLSEPAPPAAANPAASGKRRGRPPKRSAELFDVAASSAADEAPA